MIQLNTSQPSVQRKGEGEENLHPLNPLCNKSNNTSRSCFTLQCCAICTSLCLFASFLRTCFANVTAVPQKTRASDFLLSCKSKQTNKRKCIFKAITNMDKKEKKTKILGNGIDKAYVFKWDLLLYWKEEGIIPARYKNPKYTFGQRKYNLTTFKSSF